MEINGQHVKCVISASNYVKVTHLMEESPPTIIIIIMPTIVEGEKIDFFFIMK